MLRYQIRFENLIVFKCPSEIKAIFLHKQTKKKDFFFKMNTLYVPEIHKILAQVTCSRLLSIMVHRAVNDLYARSLWKNEVHERPFIKISGQAFIEG